MVWLAVLLACSYPPLALACAASTVCLAYVWCCPCVRMRAIDLTARYVAFGFFSTRMLPSVGEAGFPALEGAVAAAAVAAPAPSAVARRLSGGTMCGGLGTIVRVVASRRSIGCIISHCARWGCRPAPWCWWMRKLDCRSPFINELVGRQSLTCYRASRTRDNR